MKRITSFLVCLMFMSVISYGQDVQITGKVTSADDGSSLPGVTVVVKGTTTGATTSIDGTYSLNVPADATLVFSYIGMISQEIPVSGRTSIDVALEVDRKTVEEVIVVGYGTSTREANTGSVAVIKSETIKDVPEQSFDKMLAGKIAGVQITSTSGQPGAGSQIRIRGASSINSGNNPLIVVDGIPVSSGDQSTFLNTSNALGAINSSDIESVSVLKDAAAAAIYGSRAGNGVILVTTKSGKEGKTQFSFKTNHGFTQLASDNGYRSLTPHELRELRQTAVLNSGENPNDPLSTYYIPDSVLQGPMTNWLKEVSRNGKISEYEFSIRGGSEKTKHYTSAKYGRTDGVFLGIDNEIYQFRSNIDHKVNNNLSYGVKLSGAHTNANDMPMQNLYYANPLFVGMFIDPTDALYDEEGAYNLILPSNLNTNIVASSAFDDQWAKINKLYGILYLEWSPIKNLKIKTNNAVESTFEDGRRYWSPKATLNQVPTVQVTRTQYSNLSSSNTASYFRLFNEHSINVLAGSEFFDYRSNQLYVNSPNVDVNIPYPNTSTIAEDRGNYSLSRSTMASFFGIVDYNYASKYYFKASYRKDGSSLFGANFRWGTFYSVGLSWNMHNEDFMKGLTYLDIFKLKFSYGLSGNDAIGLYEQYGTYSADQYNGISGMSPDRPENQNLTWENVGEYNIAIDFGFLNKISGVIEVYNRLTTDMLLSVPVSQTSGFATFRQNVGSASNKGTELFLEANIINSDISWNVGFNIALNKSEIIDLTLEEGEYIDGAMIRKEGEKILTFYSRDYAGVNPVNGEALWYNEEGEITNVFSEARRRIMGSPEPKFLGGFNTDVSWRGISLQVYFEYKYGNLISIGENELLLSDGQYILNNQMSPSLDYWKKPGDVTTLPIPIANNSTSSNVGGSRNLFDGSYLRVKNVSLSYNFPEDIASKLRLNNLRLYTSAKNLYTFHDVDFWDPERGERGTGLGIYPMTKSIVFGLDLTF